MMHILRAMTWSEEKETKSSNLEEEKADELPLGLQTYNIRLHTSSGNTFHEFPLLFHKLAGNDLDIN